MEKETHIIIDREDGTAYLQRLEPTQATDTPLSDEEEMIVFLHRKLQSLKPTTKQSKGIKDIMFKYGYCENLHNQPDLKRFDEYREDFRKDLESLSLNTTTNVPTTCSHCGK